MICRRVLHLLMATLFLYPLLGGRQAHGLDPRFELDPRTLQQRLPSKDLGGGAKKAPVSPPRTAGERTYTVRQGDHLMKILVRDFGMSSSSAEALVPEIKRRNGLSDIRHLKAGTQIVIPAVSKAAGHAARTRRAKAERPAGTGQNYVGHGFTLFRNAAGSAAGEVAHARVIWDKLLPGKKLTDDTVSIKGSNYSLELAPDRFPLLPAADGGKVLIEAEGRLSPMVKTLIQDHDPGIRFVSCTLENPRRFYANLLAAGGFYSVEENFTVSFGDDPKLTVRADFKVENSPDSPMQNDIFMLNVEPRQGGFPVPLADFLARQGFRVIDLYPGTSQERTGQVNSVHVIAEGEPGIMADRLMSAMGLNFDQNKEIDLLTMQESGVSLRVKADRYFEKGGEKFVVSVFKGDIENYTLLRLLESQRYHVIVLTPDENFRSVAGKFISQLRLHGNYAMQDLLASRNIPYSIQMTGLMVNSPQSRGTLFITGAKPDPVIEELLELNGYAVYDGKERIVRK